MPTPLALRGFRPVAPATPGVAGVGLAVPSDFQRQLAHELKNHIASLQSASYLLSRHGIDLTAERERKWLATCDRSIEAMRRAVEQVEQLERALGDAHPALRETVELRPWLEALAVRAGVGEEVADWTWQAGGKPGEHWVLPRRAADDAWPCLFANVARFAEPGTRPALRLRARDGGLELEVETAGAGLSAEEAGRLGEPFFQGQNARGRGGAGLGIPLALVLLTRCGGALWHEGPAVDRTVFRSWIPAVRAL
ncbi:MAG: HAMP domain-containing histidine kinase [Verrucomicrobia bacterium]|nr:HAMP domain-containing histidine kinase [Verrucomicrobiota bacterium]